MFIVMVDIEGETLWHVKVMDFGLAKQMAPPNNQALAVTPGPHGSTRLACSGGVLDVL